MIHSNSTRSSEIEHDRVNADEDDEIILQGFINCPWRTIFVGAAVVLTGGLFLIPLLMRSTIKIRLMKKRCSLDRAQTLILKDKYGEEFVEQIHQSTSYRYFIHKKLKYIWSSEYKYFIKLKGLDMQKCSVLYSQVGGASTSEASRKYQLYGPNSIEIEVKPIWKLAVDEATGPFYLYEFFIVIVWLMQLYYQFAACILILSIVSVATHVWQTRKQAKALRKKVQSSSIVTVIRDSIPVQKNSTELIPGDVIILPKHSSQTYQMECDAVLMTGSCIMDESMLTGESLPVPKVPLVDNPNNLYSSSIHKSNTLFSGTKLLNVHGKENDDATAVVVRTGFSTTKGELARSILYPVPMNNNIKRQMIIMSIIFVVVIGIPSFFYTYYALTKYDFPLYHVLIIVLDVGTFLIPPALPAVLTSVNVHAQRRLKNKGIFCLNSQAICAAGQIDVMCFDKTGTLTEDSIDFAGILPCSNGQFGSSLPDIKSLSANNIIVKTMATCHSLVEYKGNLEGDDLDMKLFFASDWNFVQIDDDLNETFGKTPERIVANTKEESNSQLIGIMKQFPFESFLQRMLVVIKDTKENKFLSIVKGAPELLKSFCLPQTLPGNYDETLEQYTSKGFRVIAAASKIIPTNNADECLDMNRSDLECDMAFNGFYFFKNKLKPTSFEILQELSEANIRCIMATGDNILTAINVAQECNMVPKSDAIIRVRAKNDKVTNKLLINYNYVKHPDFTLVNNNGNIESGDYHEKPFNYHLAIDGESFTKIKNNQPDLAEKIVHKGTVFARMTPDQKLNLISILRNQDHSVGMCGDGANDCGALRAADAGISLSVAEASVASPFTYKNKDISCVPSLLKEGRCTLVSVFGAFKYQVVYCFILLGAALILIWHGLRPSDTTYVFVDIIMNIMPPMVFATTHPYPKLSKRMPIRNLLSFIPQISIYSFILFQVLLYYLARNLVMQEPWYQDISKEDLMPKQPPSHLTFAIFSLNTMSYVIAAIIFAPGPPYRKGFFSNKIYIIVAVAINFVLAFSMGIISPKAMTDFLDFIEMPLDFRLKLGFISLMNFILMFIWEKYILNKFVFNHILPWIRIRCRYKSKKRFRKLNELIQQENWPFEHLAANGQQQSQQDNTMKSNTSNGSR